MKQRSEIIFILVTIVFISFLGCYSLASPTPYVKNTIIGNCIFQERILPIYFYKLSSIYWLFIELTFVYLFGLLFTLLTSSTTKIFAGLAMIFMLGYSLLDISSLTGNLTFSNLIHSTGMEIGYGVFSIIILIIALIFRK